MLGFFDKKKKILFVEDDPVILNMYETYFGNNKDYTTMFASNKLEFLQHYEKADVVVSDYHIPSLKFDEVKKRCAEKGIALILISGDIQPYHKIQLSKPIQMKTILKEIEKQLMINQSVKKAA